LLHSSKLSERAIDKNWYFDACALEEKKRLGSLATACSKGGAIVVVSHLSLGEAYGSCVKKDNNDISRGGEGERLRTFNSLIQELCNAEYLCVVSNEDIDEILEKTRDYFKLSITDAMHLATALKHHCQIVKTTDRDLSGLNASKLKQLGSLFNNPHFQICTF